jgi:DNA-binding CsgD family transcriptional regulator
MFEPARRAELKAGLNACVRRGPAELIARHGVNRGQLLLLDRIPGHGHRKLVLVRVVDPSMPPSHDVVGAMLRRVYGLTSTEIDVALQIAAGRTPKEVAEATSATTNAVHLQLRRIFEKTGTHRQAGLVRLLERLSSLRRS